MKTPDHVPLVKAALLALAEIKAATEAFDRGDDNVFDVLDAIMVAIDAYRSTARVGREAAQRARASWTRGTLWGSGYPVAHGRGIRAPSRP